MAGSTEILAEKNTKGNAGAVARIVALVLIILTFIVLIFVAMPKNADLSGIWDERTTIGDVKAKNHFVMTTDVMCPYCDYFSRAIMNEQAEFEKYLKENDVVFEIRITDFLNEYGEAGEMSELAAEATLCATEENHFWDYYHATMAALYYDYHSKGIGNAKGAPMMSIPENYWINIGEEIGLGESFKDCYNNHKMLEQVRENTAKTAKIMQKSNAAGMPYFKFNDFETTGFDTSWDWSYIKRYFDIGLNKE
jgi:protein-disulfide isomerase